MDYLNEYEDYKDEDDYYDSKNRQNRLTNVGIADDFDRKRLIELAMYSKISNANVRNIENECAIFMYERNHFRGKSHKITETNMVKGGIVKSIRNGKCCWKILK